MSKNVKTQLSDNNNENRHENVKLPVTYEEYNGTLIHNHPDKVHAIKWTEKVIEESSRAEDNAEQDNTRSKMKDRDEQNSTTHSLKKIVETKLVVIKIKKKPHTDRTTNVALPEESYNKRVHKIGKIELKHKNDQLKLGDDIGSHNKSDESHGNESYGGTAARNRESMASVFIYISVLCLVRYTHT